MERGRGTLMDHENFEIIKTLVASTGHSTTHDLDTLENTNLGYCAYSTEYGIRVYLDDDIISRMKLEGTNLSELYKKNKIHDIFYNQYISKCERLTFLGI